MRNNEKILKAKRELYSILLSLSVGDITDNEVDIAYYLSLDKQIQELLSIKMKEKNK